MKTLALVLLSMTLMTAAKCQGLKECPKTGAEWNAFKRATIANKNREEGLKNFKRLVTTTKIANCKQPEFGNKEPLLQTFAYKLTRAAGVRGMEKWDSYHEQMVRHLFTLNVNVDAIDGTAARQKALHAACTGDSIQYLKLLLELGVDPASFTFTVGGTKEAAISACSSQYNYDGVITLLETNRIPKEDICQAYGRSADDDMAILFEDYGWNPQTCRITF